MRVTRLSAIFSAPRFATLFAVLPPLFWSGSFLIARVMRDDIPPIQMSFWRWVAAFLILLPFALPHWRGQGARIREELPFLCVLGAVGILAFNCFLYAALHTTTVVNAALINSLAPVVTFLFALALLRDRLRGVQVGGVAAALAGVALIIGRGDVTGLAALAPNRGDLLVMAAVTFWAAYTVGIRWRPTKLPPRVFLAVTMGLGAAFHLPLVAWEVATGGGFEVTAATVGAILYFAIFPSVLAYLIWNKAVAVLGPGRTGMYLYLMPFFGAVLGVGLLDEDFLFYHLGGIGLILAGIALVNRTAPSP
ncbi:MAG: DMT family transporter [Alphaproteobacteria bacterium]|nr:DMT family transporter [Alphaproteobacteria bacterium]